MRKVLLTVHTPKNFIQPILDCIDAYNGGIIGNYSHCSFITEGIGTFIPREGANPTVGKKDILQREPECKIESICEYQSVSALVQALKKIHPYEEMAYHITDIVDRLDI